MFYTITKLQFSVMRRLISFAVEPLEVSTGFNGFYIVVRFSLTLFGFTNRLA